MTQTTQVSSLDTTIHKTNQWLKRLADDLDVDREVAYDALRVWLYALRDCLNIDEASEFAAQLPTLIRGVFYTGWEPSAVPKSTRREDFLARLREEGNFDGTTRPGPEITSWAVTELIRDRITEGEINDVLSQLRSDVKALLEER